MATATLPSNPCPNFTACRREPELIAPANPTPHGFKRLSNIDDQKVLRFQVPGIQFYRNNPSMKGKDPVNVIKEALAKTLVFYYPFAGRLREDPDGKLFVDCTGEGVMFVEADADVALDQFTGSLHPPFPCLPELLYNVPGSDGITNSPLLLIQVTRLKCGGFVFAIRFNHTMTDGTGLLQFMTAVAEIARGASAPSIKPVWERHRLNARDPPMVTCSHYEYNKVPDSKIPQNQLSHRLFFFGPSQISAIRELLPSQLRRCSRFEALIACLWRCRTIALQLEPDEEVRLLVAIRAQDKLDPPLIPRGYYGNAFVFPAVITTAGKLCGNPLGYALELVRKIKESATGEYMRSLADMIEIKGRPEFTMLQSNRSYIVSDMTQIVSADLDFGWGRAVYGGPAVDGVVPSPGVGSYFIAHRNEKGEDGIEVPICLPAPAMERFVKEMDKVLKEGCISGRKKTSIIPSAL